MQGVLSRNWGVKKVTIKKFRLFIASNVEKEEQWLTKMSCQGQHFYKHRLGMYYFEENPNESYVYQIDFLHDVDDEYFQLYQDAGWEHVNTPFSSLKLFHYFRTNASRPGIKKIYSDRESGKESYQRMMSLYIAIFFFLILSQVGLIFTWQGFVIQIISTVLVGFVLLLYIYLLIALKRKINFYR